MTIRSIAIAAAMLLTPLFSLAATPDCNYDELSPGSSCRVTHQSVTFILENDTDQSFAKIHDSFSISSYNMLYRECRGSFRTNPSQFNALKNKCEGKAKMTVYGWNHLTENSTQKLSDILANRSPHFQAKETEVCRSFTYLSSSRMGCVWY
ncbi:MAG: hypothetical protein P1U40_11440 [Coxiellaceae bacterium]|nr:hypothetical protein [Coxiellaceae bacterium]